MVPTACRSGEAWNEGRFADAKFDAEPGEALAIADADERGTVMPRIERIVQDEGVLIRPGRRALHDHAGPRVHGVEVHSSREHHHCGWWMSALRRRRTNEG